MVEEAADASFKAIRKHVDGSGGTAWDIRVITGGVRDSLGIDPVTERNASVMTTVGFDESGLHPTGRDMASLLSALFAGTFRMEARPVIENTWAGELSSSLPDIPRSKGLVRV